MIEKYNLQGKKVILTVARLVKRKGHDLVLMALNLLKDIENLHYLIVGSGEDKERLREIVETLGLSDRVTFAGWVDNTGHLEKAQKILWEEGIDTGRMYERPINHIYDWLGYEREPEPFPDAAYIAPCILTLPSHPYLTGKNIDVMIEVVKTVVSGSA